MKKKIQLIHLRVTPLCWMIIPSNILKNYQRTIMFLCFVITIDYKIGS